MHARRDNRDIIVEQDIISQHLYLGKIKCYREENINMFTGWNVGECKPYCDKNVEIKKLTQRCLFNFSKSWVYKKCKITTKKWLSRWNVWCVVMGWKIN